jgi:hypothetical protein
MSMGLYSMPDIYQTSWIEMKSNVKMRYEVDRDNDLATLFFGFRDEYVVSICRQNLEQLLHLGAAAQQELAACHRPGGTCGK